MFEYDKMMDEYIGVIKEGKGLWNVIKDEAARTFSIFGPSLHDFDFMYLYSKLAKQDYLIQLDACSVTSTSFDSIKKTFLGYGYKWEDPAEMMSRLIDKI